MLGVAIKANGTRSNPGRVDPTSIVVTGPGWNDQCSAAAVHRASFPVAKAKSLGVEWLTPAADTRP